MTGLAAAPRLIAADRGGDWVDLAGEAGLEPVQVIVATHGGPRRHGYGGSRSLELL